MSAGIYNFTIEQGASFALELEYTDSNGDPVDLTNYFAEMQIASNYADYNRTIYTTLLGGSYTGYPSNATGISLTGAYDDYELTDGKIGIIMHPATTVSLGQQFDTAFYDLELYTTTNGLYSGIKNYSIRLLQGRIKISKEVTRFTA